MRVLIVHAHPEPKSFCSALASEAVRTLTADGHDVVLSDLYAMKWNPRSDQGNFTALQDPGHFKQQAEEMLASEHGGFAPDVAAELDKLLACDALIFQFPLWWFSMPALLKGWVDRVFALGAIYGRGRWYDRGVFAGRRAMLSLTTGGRESMYGPDGLNGDLTALLYPIHHGILRFVGFDVLPPFVAWEPAHLDAPARAAYLGSYRDRLHEFQTTEPLAFPHLDQFDEQTFRLKMANAS